MTFAAMVVFSVALCGIVVLFLLKKIEVARGRRFAEGLRYHADEGALNVKHVLLVSNWYLERSPWFLSVLARYGIHFGALSFAKLARTLEAQAYNLADFVSHKRNFERRETKSDFLKQVSGRVETVPPAPPVAEVVPAVPVAAPVETFAHQAPEPVSPAVTMPEPKPASKKRRSRKKVARS